jgi:hypothetical protein
MQSRLRIAIEKLKALDKNLTNREIMTTLGYNSQNYLTDLFSGKREISGKFLSKLEDVFFIRKKWIETGEGEIFVDTSAQIERIMLDIMPDLTQKQKRFCRLIIEAIAKNRAEVTRSPYLRCLSDIVTEIAKGVASH